MRFLHSKVKAKKGGKIRVKTSKPTRILIMNERHYKRYKNNLTFTYFGGEKDGEYEFNVPTTDIWNVVVEKGSYQNPLPITATIEVEKGVAKTHSVPRTLAHNLDEADEMMDARESEGAAASDEEDEA